MPKAPFTREHNRSTSFSIVLKIGTLKGCVQTGTLQIEPFRSKKWNNRENDPKVERYASVSLCSRLNRQIENMSTERLHFRLNTKQNWYAVILFPCEQPICPLQELDEDGMKMERNDYVPM